ncbi:MAG: ABC transporter permease [Armatimonadetes bacterium]|nr:ABC transporter permease [Armatimonadota bacterium]
MSTFGLFGIEIFKQFRRLRTHIGTFGLLGIVLAVAIGLKYGDASHFVGRLTRQPNFQIYGSPVNALFLARVVLPMTVFLFLPLFVSLVAGDQISGEAADGTLRTVLTRPVNRFALLSAKFTLAIVYVGALTAFLGVAALTVGWALFGVGGLVSFGWDGVSYFGIAEGVHRLTLSYGLAAVYVLAVASVAFLVSTLSSNSLVPIGVTMALMVMCGVLGQIPYFESAKPYLFTTYSELFLRAFDVPVDYPALRHGVFALLVYVVACFCVSALIFTRKDILS